MRGEDSSGGLRVSDGARQPPAVTDCVFPDSQGTGHRIRRGWGSGLGQRDHLPRVKLSWNPLVTSQEWPGWGSWDPPRCRSCVPATTLPFPPSAGSWRSPRHGLTFAGSPDGHPAISAATLTAWPGRGAGRRAARVAGPAGGLAQRSVPTAGAVRRPDLEPLGGLGALRARAGYCLGLEVGV